MLRNAFLFRSSSVGSFRELCLPLCYINKEAESDWAITALWVSYNRIGMNSENHLKRKLLQGGERKLKYSNHRLNLFARLTRTTHDENFWKYVWSAVDLWLHSSKTLAEGNPGFSLTEAFSWLGPRQGKGSSDTPSHPLKYSVKSQMNLNSTWWRRWTSQVWGTKMQQPHFLCCLHFSCPNCNHPELKVILGTVSMSYKGCGIPSRLCREWSTQ